jgi:hypothetical protein
MWKAVLMGLVAAGLWGALIFWSEYTESGRIDGCLDDGGRWNYEQGRCEGNRSAP